MEKKTSPFIKRSEQKKKTSHALQKRNKEKNILQTQQPPQSHNVPWHAPFQKAIKQVPS